MAVKTALKCLNAKIVVLVLYNCLGVFHMLHYIVA